MSVALADDHPIFREGVAAAIAVRPELRLTGVAGDGARALALVAERNPDVLVLDLDLPVRDGFAVLEALDADGPPRTLVVSGALSSGAVYRALELGARGYLLKTATADEVCDAIAAVARGQTVLGAELHDGLAGEVRLRRELPDGPTLTPRELEILRLSADGIATAGIAAALHVSPATVKTHLQHAFEKLEVSDRAAAVAKAMRAGLLR